MTDVERTVQFEADADEVWDALTDAALLDEWFAGDVEVELRPGGALRVTSGDDVRHGVVDHVDAPRRLSFTWWSDDEHPASTVELELEPRDDGCTLRVREAILEAEAHNQFPVGFQAPPMHRAGEALALARS